ncbi:RHS repeat-associated core domain-containing protein [Pseudomonas monteilii]
MIIYRADPLGQPTRLGDEGSRLLGADRSGSPLLRARAQSAQQCIYTAYGYTSYLATAFVPLGFNGQPRTKNGLYLLGQGHRAYSPTFMRFLSPDAWSPFEKGGLNAYAYCKNDPVNFTDPSGRFLKGLGRALGLTRTRKSAVGQLARSVAETAAAFTKTNFNPPTYNEALAFLEEPPPAYSVLPSKDQKTLFINKCFKYISTDLDELNYADYAKQVMHQKNEANNQLKKAMRQIDKLKITDPAYGQYMEYIGKLITTASHYEYLEDAAFIVRQGKASYR